MNYTYDMNYKWILILVIVAISIVLYTYARYKNKYYFLRIIQPVTTLLFVIIASIGTFKYGSHYGYTMMIMLALSFALAGDCNLIELNKNRMFLIAILFYWLGLISYSIIFTSLIGFSIIILTVFLILLIVTGITMRIYFWEGLKREKLLIPIIIYSITWCYLLSHTLTIFFSNTTFFTPTQKLLILLGSGLYFLGDLDLSFHKFNSKFSGRPYWLGALLYCIGQLLIALSASLFFLYGANI